MLDSNPAGGLELPAKPKELPRYLTTDDSIHLLESIEGKYAERDYCILTLFLNCGLRVSELVGLNLTDVRDGTLRVRGKGNKSVCCISTRRARTPSPSICHAHHAA